MYRTHLNFTLEAYLNKSAYQWSITGATHKGQNITISLTLPSAPPPPGALPHLIMRWSLLIASQMEAVLNFNSHPHLCTYLLVWVTVHYMKTRGQRCISFNQVSRQACVHGSSVCTALSVWYTKHTHSIHCQSALPCNILIMSIFWVLVFLWYKNPYRQKLHLIYHFSHGSKTIKK